MKKNFLLPLLLAIFSLPTLAGYDGYLNNCNVLITVKNSTQDMCILEDVQLLAGHDDTLFTPKIAPGEKAYFVLRHAFTNAKYKIFYKCGNEQDGYKRIGLYNRRNFGFIWAGHASGKVIADQTDPGITASITSKSRGSITFYLNAYIDWSIHDS